MQGKIESQNFFKSIPEEITKRILLTVENPKDQRNIALTYSMFNKLTLAERLTLAVTGGHRASVGAIIKNHPELLLHRLDFKDKSGRLFKFITVWEYALWALDMRYMAPLMLQCLPYNEQGKKIRIALDTQFNELEKGGITYELNGSLYNEKHYDFSIISALTDFVDNFQKRGSMERNKAWCAVGDAQWLVPPHVVQHYCDPDQTFDPTPTFTEKKLNCSLMILNQWGSPNSKEHNKSWFNKRTETSGLGINFAILRAGGDGMCSKVFVPLNKCIPWTTLYISASADLEAMETLQEQRIEDLGLLKSELQKQIQSDDIESDIEIMKVPS